MLVNLENAVDLIFSGSVVAVPTDTVYGLAARYDDTFAIQEIFDLKGRPEDRPLTIIVSDVGVILPWIHPKMAGKFLELAEQYWPGGLTLVVETIEGVISNDVRRGRIETGFRVPGDPNLRNFLKKTGPLVNPSANLSGKPAAVNAREVEDYFGKKIPILDFETSVGGLASTVIRLKVDGIELLRPGAVSLDAIN